MPYYIDLKNSEFSQFCKELGRKVTPRLLTKLFLFIEAESAGNTKILEKLTAKFPIVYTIYIRMCSSHYDPIYAEDTYVSEPYDNEPFSELRLITYKKCKKKYKKKYNHMEDIKSIEYFPYVLFQPEDEDEDTLILIKSKDNCFDPLDIGKTMNRVIKIMEETHLLPDVLTKKILEYAGRPPLQKKMFLTYTILRTIKSPPDPAWTDDEGYHYFEFETSEFYKEHMMKILHHNPLVIHSLVEKFPEAMMHLSKLFI